MTSISRYVDPSGIRAVAALIGALALTALVILPALGILQWTWVASRAGGIASATTVSACRESGGRWVPNMCMFEDELGSRPRADGHGDTSRARSRHAARGVTTDGGRGLR